MALWNNNAYVSTDGGNTWTTELVLAHTNEGAGIAFDDMGNCYYTTLSGDFYAVCMVKKVGDKSWRGPALFGAGDKTAVAARGNTALCGFDRGPDVRNVNAEACAFTTNGGVLWTVHEFPDTGLGTGPLVSYDEQHLYIIYAALDNNLKMYASHNQGTSWIGPLIIASGNAYQTMPAGRLRYQVQALTSPGTNVAIDGSGRIHVLFIDSAKHVPMYTSCSDPTALTPTWTVPVNVDPERAPQAHMFPCLACNRQGDLQGGSLVYDGSKYYEVLQHEKAHDEDSWSTSEADNGPWEAGNVEPGQLLGFGDYFDCDCSPEFGHAVLAWSETPNGYRPWKSFARFLDLCKRQEQKVERLANEIETPLEAFADHEIPIPRTPANIAKFWAGVADMRKQLSTAGNALERCRAANPLPGT